MNNIYWSKDGAKIKFHHRCVMCMRCSFFCPKDAFSIGFINSWRVSNYYNLKAIEKDDTIPADYITENTTGFYYMFHQYP